MNVVWKGKKALFPAGEPTPLILPWCLCGFISDILCLFGASALKCLSVCPLFVPLDGGPSVYVSLFSGCLAVGALGKQ